MEHRFAMRNNETGAVVSSARPGMAILPSPDAPAFRGFAWCAAVVLAARAGLTAVCKAGPEQLFAQSRQAMGTTFTIYLYTANEEQAAEYFEAAFEEIERLDEALSNYRTSSELSRINRLAANEAVTTDPEVFELLEQSLDYSRRSGGAFDITVGPLMRAWGFFRGKGRYPAAEKLARARVSVGWQGVVLDPARVP